MNVGLKIVLIMAVLIGAILMVNNFTSQDSFEYEKFSSKDSELNISMEYIAGWSANEQRGSHNSYAQAIFVEPMEAEGFKATMVAYVQRNEKAQFEPVSLKGAEDDLISRRLKFKDAKVVSNSKLKLLNTEAVDIELSYKMLDKLYQTDAKLIEVKERVVIFAKNDKFYTLRYSNRAEEFEKLDKAFYHCLKSLEIKD